MHGKLRPIWGAHKKVGEGGELGAKRSIGVEREGNVVGTGEKGKSRVKGVSGRLDIT